MEKETRITILKELANSLKKEDYKSQAQLLKKLKEGRVGNHE